MISGPDNGDVSGFVTDVSLNFNPPHRSLIGCYSPAGRCPPPHLDPFRPSHSLDYSAPLPLMSRKRRKPSSSSASSSSYSSSDSSSTSDSEDSDPRNERTKTTRREGSEKEKSRKWWIREKLGDLEERKRKTRKSQGRQRGQDRRQVEDAEAAPKEGVMDEPSRHKNRKEKKKIKGDTRTEEERLWDDSILGF